MLVYSSHHLSPIEDDLFSPSFSPFSARSRYSHHHFPLTYHHPRHYGYHQSVLPFSLQHRLPFPFSSSASLFDPFSPISVVEQILVQKLEPRTESPSQTRQQQASSSQNNNNGSNTATNTGTSNTTKGIESPSTANTTSTNTDTRSPTPISSSPAGIPSPSVTPDILTNTNTSDDEKSTNSTTSATSNKDNETPLEHKYDDVKVNSEATTGDADTKNNDTTTASKNDTTTISSPSGPSSPTLTSFPSPSSTSASASQSENEKKEHGDEKTSVKEKDHDSKSKNSISSPFLEPFPLSSLRNRRLSPLPSLEFHRTIHPDHYEYTTLIPASIPRDQLELSYESQLLNLRAEIKHQETDENNKIISFTKKQIHSAITVPSDADQASISAKFDHNKGTLTIKINRNQRQNTGNTITIQ